jgi:hypothetical protein
MSSGADPGWGPHAPIEVDVCPVGDESRHPLVFERIHGHDEVERRAKVVLHPQRVVLDDCGLTRPTTSWPR